MLAYEVAFSARGGNVLVPYISHDIGGFHGAKIDFDLYARWIEFGTFSPILRMHSAHANPREGNMRMPWVYGTQGMALMRKYFTLRTQLLPYLYTYTWLAHTESVPILRPLYLQYPQLEEAYQHDLTTAIRLKPRVYAHRPLAGRLVENACRLMSPVL